MARSVYIIQPAPALQHSGIQTIDVTNGMHFDLSNPQVQLLRQQWPMHLILSNTGSTANVTVRAGYLPFAQGMSQGDLVTSVAAGVTDLGFPLDLSRHGRDAYGSFDVDFAAGIAGTLLLVFGLAANVPANTAQLTILKHLPGYLLAAYVTTLGTAALSHVDHQGGSAGANLHTIPGSAPVGSIYTPGATARQGLTAVGVASGPAITAIFT